MYAKAVIPVIEFATVEVSIVTLLPSTRIKYHRSVPAIARFEAAPTWIIILIPAAVTIIFAGISYVGSHEGNSFGITLQNYDTLHLCPRFWDSPEVCKSQDSAAIHSSCAQSRLFRACPLAPSTPYGTSTPFWVPKAPLQPRQRLTCRQHRLPGPAGSKFVCAVPTMPARKKEADGRDKPGHDSQ
jgi:hypothetical protein